MLKPLGAQIEITDNPHPYKSWCKSKPSCPWQGIAESILNRSRALVDSDVWPTSTQEKYMSKIIIAIAQYHTSPTLSYLKLSDPEIYREYA